MGCAMGQRCTSSDMNPGLCEPLVEPHFGGGGCKYGGGTGGGGVDEDRLGNAVADPGGVVDRDAPPSSLTELLVESMVRPWRTRPETTNCRTGSRAHSARGCCLSKKRRTRTVAFCVVSCSLSSPSTRSGQFPSTLVVNTIVVLFCAWLLRALYVLGPLDELAGALRRGEIVWVTHLPERRGFIDFLLFVAPRRRWAFVTPAEAHELLEHCMPCAVDSRGALRPQAR